METPSRAEESKEEVKEKKKFGKWKIAGIVIGAMFVIGLFMGDSDEAPAPDVEEPKQELASGEAEAPKEDTNAEEVVKEEPVKNDEELETVDETKYYFEVALISEKFSEIMYDFQDVNSEMAEDFSVTQDEEWVMRTVAIIMRFKEAIKEYREVDVPAGMKEPHSFVLKAMDDYEYVTENYARAIDRMDVDLLDKVITALENGNSNIQKATLLIDEKTDD